MSRLEKTAKNATLTIINTVVGSLLGFVARTVFIRVLGEEYLGLSGLLNNVLGFLTITELGISTAIGFSLYKPLAENDHDSVSALMSTYRKAYFIIGCIVSFAGIILYFLLDFFVPPAEQPAGTGIAYFVFLFNTALGYFISYKTTLIVSDNQSYRIVPISIAFNIGQTLLQIVVLLVFRSYLAYLAAHLICSSLLMITRNRFITKQYPSIDFYTKKKLSVEQTYTVKRNIGGLVIAKVGDYLVNSTDNLIITKLVSLSATGIYSNYLMIRNVVNGFISALFSSITASMGNIVAVEDDAHKLRSFETVMFFSYFIYSFEAVCFLCLFNPFIGEIWIGNQYTFNTSTVLIIVINNYLTGLRIPLITMKNAAGTYMEDAWIPFGFAGINLIASIILAKRIGVAGVFLGTIIGSLCTADWYRPLIIYRHVFHASVGKYYKRYLTYVFLGFALMAGGWYLCSLVNMEFPIITFVLKCCIAVFFPIAVNILLFHKNEDYRYLVSSGKRLFIKAVRVFKH